MSTTYSMPQRLAAEFLGTFWLVFGGCGAAVLAAAVPDVGIGYLGVAFAFGLSVVTMAYAVGHASGGHFNPAVTVGLAAGRRFAWKDVPGYVVVQVVAAAVAALVLFIIANGVDGFSAKESGFATNGYGDRSPGGYELLAVIVAEVVLTAFFLYVILGATDTRAPRGFAPLAIGLSLTLIHLVSIPVDNTSVNPARSTGPALFAGTEALSQLWVFWLAPLVGGLIAGATYAFLIGKVGEAVPLPETTEA
ncbi:MAG TPA: aquaporin Z [Nocardioidaceae bacterium]|nr:aquaporin Z [Nocardioidaceae bacterium]